MTHRQRRGSHQTICEDWIIASIVDGPLRSGALVHRQEEDFRRSVVNLNGLRLVLVPGESKTVAVRTNRGHKRPRAVAGEPPRFLTRDAGGIEGLEVHLVLAWRLVGPGQPDAIAIPGEVRADRFTWRVGHAT